MDTRQRWIPYDTFKLIVAILLLLVFVWLLLRSPAAPSLAAPSLAATQAIAGGQAAPTQAAPTQAAPAAPTAAAPTATATAMSTSTPAPTPTPTLEPALPTPTPTPTITVSGQQATAGQQQVPGVKPPAPTPAAGPVDCPKALPPRLVIGKHARLQVTLNLRAGAGMKEPILSTNQPGSVAEVTGGPVCELYQGGAYLWWNLRLPGGATGWSAEGSLTTKNYFLEPVE